MRQKWADAMLASVYSESSSTPTPTTTSSQTPSGMKISGYIGPDFSPQASKSGFTVEVAGDSSSGRTITDDKGYFELNGISSGSLKIKISKPSFLSREITKTFNESTIVLGTEESPVAMWAGDIRKDGVSDNAINMADIIEIAKGFNSIYGEVKYSQDYDLNLDKSINMSDVIIVARHFSAIPSSYPAL